MPGHRARSSRIVAANAEAPPSGRSSRATLVTTTCSRSMCAIASATRRGSSSSNQVGRPVLTAQKPQARVHTSPRIMTVAVRWSQHSPRLGHMASSQTVLRFSPASVRRRSWYVSPDGIRARIHSGWRRCGAPDRVGRASDGAAHGDGGRQGRGVGVPAGGVDDGQLAGHR